MSIFSPVFLIGTNIFFVPLFFVFIDNVICDSPSILVLLFFVTCCAVYPFNPTVIFSAFSSVVNLNCNVIFSSLFQSIASFVTVPLFNIVVLPCFSVMSVICSVDSAIIATLNVPTIDFELFVLSLYVIVILPLNVPTLNISC